MFSIMVIKVSTRNKIAPTVQEILTKHGCIIKTRLGIHEATNDTCSRAGLIILDLLSDNKDDINTLKEDLNSLDGVCAKLVEI
ncbi:hypothetical protein BH721_05475 [Clostridium baratii]|uniref:Iron-only hydrogenase system regulator n=1 Tax=Clostridium nitritogenes TaxID=83340 RepID=A0ABP3X4S8_9CLOT|nr:hypothetical protein [Clostridium baratii]AQM60654.1 hypothetical protein NPD11_1252 [Clostridium baratii]MBS6041532.1 hypothetical protein [Clostridium baratii]MBT9831103.1 hypothetical protein [Clostridium baratii]MDY3207447.1 hypothetical protein [Clostridium baratii]OPF52710.1 hypothetical protein A1M12_11685 [Clostridium baratii]